jgi:hypothetical protein
LYAIIDPEAITTMITLNAWDLVASHESKGSEQM